MIDRLINRALRTWHAVWSRSHVVVNDRRELFQAVHASLEEPITYLEFGVWKGAAIKWWVDHLGPDSQLIGFDSFQGLREDWIEGFPKGHFSTDGIPPDLQAPNLSFVVGWFEDTLPAWVAEHQALLSRRVLVYIDCDLYAPTRLILETLRTSWTPGTIIMFDEFWFWRHEYRALREFCRAHQRTYRFRVLGRGAPRVAIEWL